jgi:Zn-dependent peptidase ImmA (M78 family)
MRFTPVGPGGSLPADAARQGYKLARKVRAELQLGGEPLGDMRVFFEEQLGIAVVVDALVSYDLRAASILDMNRAAAAVVIASPHRDLERNPTLARVYLAHELGHLLFDPGTPRTIRLALDNRSMLGEGPIDLLESRAKGFAAELLIPRQGLCALFGEPLVSVGTLAEAREMVARTRDHFGTPTEIAARHLGNLGFIRQELILDLLNRPPAPAIQPVTTLPAPAAMPCLLDALLKASPTAMLPDADPSLIEARTPPSFAYDARSAAARTMDDLSARTLEGALEALAQGREIAAGDALVEHLDDLFLAGEFEAARRFLALLDPRRLPPKVLSGVLMISKDARAELGDERVAFLARARAALSERWRLRPEQVEAICRRHA